MLRQHRRILIGVAVLVAVQAAAVALYLWKRDGEKASSRPFAAESLTPREAPPLAFEQIDRTTATLASLRGKVVMVHFWATWCVPCRDELPGLLAVARELERGGRFQLIAVSVDDEWDQIRRFFAGNVPRGIVRPDVPEVHRRFGASTLPDTYVVDARGNLVIRYSGARDWRTARAREHLERAIATSAER